MNILNIGPLEFILILVVMFILLGPEGMVKTARQIGVWIRQTVKSPIWREIMGYSREIRELPTKLVRESGLDEDLKEIRKITSEATAETQKTLQEANSEISNSLEQAGTVNISIPVDGANKNLPQVAPTGVSPDPVPVEVKPPPILID